MQTHGSSVRPLIQLLEQAVPQQPPSFLARRLPLLAMVCLNSHRDQGLLLPLWAKTLSASPERPTSLIAGMHTYLSFQLDLSSQLDRVYSFIDMAPCTAKANNPHGRNITLNCVQTCECPDFDVNYKCLKQSASCHAGLTTMPAIQSLAFDGLPSIKQQAQAVLKASSASAQPSQNSRGGVDDQVQPAWGLLALHTATVSILDNFFTQRTGVKLPYSLHCTRQPSHKGPQDKTEHSPMQETCNKRAQSLAVSALKKGLKGSACALQVMGMR